MHKPVNSFSIAYSVFTGSADDSVKLSCPLPGHMDEILIR